METPIKESDVKLCQKVGLPVSFPQAPAYSVASPNLGQGEACDWQLLSDLLGHKHVRTM